jgi:hypothetical protein
VGALGIIGAEYPIADLRNRLQRFSVRDMSERLAFSQPTAALQVILVFEHGHTLLNLAPPRGVYEQLPRESDWQ